MLVIISDLHLTDGSSGSTISAGAFHLLAERLSDMAVRASSRADGSYRPIERIDLLLLGDVLDVIRSSRWLQHSIRPWDNPHAPETFSVVSRITNDILRQNAESLGVLRQLATEGAIQIPQANQLRQPHRGTDLQPVPVHIHYMVGNHDWMYHLPGQQYDTLRQTVAQHMGLSNRLGTPFAHDPREDEAVLEVLRQHKTFARHGDIYDPFNFEEDRDMSSLGDAIVIELLNRFSAKVESELLDQLPADTLFGLREIDNIRPLVLVPVWIDGLLERTCSYPAMRKQVKRIWDELADEFLELAFVRARDTWSPVDLIDGLQRALKFSRRLSIGWASWISDWVNNLRGERPHSYHEHALKEQDFRNRRAKHVVYGHTHHHETVPLDASFSEGYVLNQLYFNSGTWRRVHRQTQLAPSEHEFIACENMTYLCFFQGDERGGRPYESWTGTLAIQPTDNRKYRIDQGSATHAFRQQVSTPGVHNQGPHFAAPAARAPLTPTRRV